MSVTELKSVSKYDSLPEGWEKLVLNQYSVGAGDTEIKGDLRITTAAWNSLYEDTYINTFRQVVDFGRIMCHAWWMKQGRMNLDNKGFNSSLWLMNMKNRFGWTDKQEVTSKDIQQMSVDELDVAIAKAVAKFGKTA